MNRMWIGAAAIAALASCGVRPAAEDRATTVTEGTQFTVETRGADLLMDLQGLLWRLPPGGGEAVALTGPEEDLRRPRISPDGRFVVYQAFAEGSWNIGIRALDGGDARLLTAGTPGALTPLADNRDPEWSRDGTRIVFSSDRSGNYDLWSMAPDGSDLVRLTRDPADDYYPSATPDGLVFVSERDRGPALYYMNSDFWTGNGEAALERLAVAPAGKLHPPRVSPDGRRVAWAQARERNGFPAVEVNELVVRELDGGAPRVLSLPNEDVFSAVPAWRDDDTLLYTRDGGIGIVRPDSGWRDTLPFRATLPLTRGQLRPRVPPAFEDGPQPVRGILDPVALPDGRLVFGALGDLWSVAVGGRLMRLTDDAFVERDPAVSPDGRRLAFISDRGGAMQVWMRDLASGEDTQLTFDSSGPRYPVFSPDGKRLAWQQVGPIGTQDFSVRVRDLLSGEERKLRSAPPIWPGRMSWSADGRFITVAELAIPSKRFNDGANRLVRIDTERDTATPEPLHGGRVPDHGPVASPDGRWLALVIDGALYRAPLEDDGRLAGPPELVLDELVESPTFVRDSDHLAFLSNRGLEMLRVANGARWDLNPALSWSPAVERGQRIVHAARLFDGEGNDYRRDVDIVIEGARIVAVRPHAPHPEGVDVIDAGAHTVLPGLVDHHVHHEAHKGEWVGRAWLAFGVTTVVEPGGLPYESREHLESWRSGRRIGPRLVYAGPQLDGDRRHFYFGAHINSERRLEQEAARGQRLGYGLLKTYTRLRPTLQRRAVQVGHAQGLPVTAHAAFRNLGFGGDRIEHLRGSSRLAYSPKQSGLLKTYADVETLIARSGGAVVPTVVAAGGFFDYAAKHPDVLENRQYVALYPESYRRGLAGFARMMSRKIDLIRRGLDNSRGSIGRLHAAGVPIVAGTDSPIFPYGLALVIELATYVDAGLSHADALRTATANAADALGAADRIGRVRPGLLADLVIVEGDPLTDIHALLQVQGVMTHGRYRPLPELLELGGESD